MNLFGILDLRASRRRGIANKNLGAFVSRVEPRTLLSGVAIYPQPAALTSPASVETASVETGDLDLDSNSSRVAARSNPFDFKLKIKYTVSNSGSSPLEITFTDLNVKDSDGFAKEYVDKIPAQKTKQFKAKIGMIGSKNLGGRGSFTVTLLRETQAVMNDVSFDADSDDAPPPPPGTNPIGTKWGRLIYQNQQLDIAFLNNQLVWSVNPLH